MEKKVKLPNSTRGRAVSDAQRPKPLVAYKAKRNFSRSPEPGVSVPVRRRNQPANLFVIHKHAARNLHYDLRLEMEGVLRSWAVPKGPPLERGQARLAMHVEDHPMDYARFEGIIPQGQYGGGTVMVWDIGTYQVRDGDPVEAYHRGKISLEFNGKKVKGAWALVRVERGEFEGKEKWLLIKSGADAHPISSREEDRSVLSGRSMEQIARHKKSPQWVSKEGA